MWKESIFVIEMCNVWNNIASFDEVNQQKPVKSFQNKLSLVKSARFYKSPVNGTNQNFLTRITEHLVGTLYLAVTSKFTHFDTLQALNEQDIIILISQ